MHLCGASLAIDHLETTKTQECPVCFKKIDNERLTKELKTKVSEEITESAKRLEESEKKIKTERRTLYEIAEENDLLSDNVGGLEKSLATSEKEVRELVPNFGKISFDEGMKSWGKGMEELSGKESELRGEQK